MSVSIAKPIRSAISKPITIMRKEIFAVSVAEVIGPVVPFIAVTEIVGLVRPTIIVEPVKTLMVAVA